MSVPARSTQWARELLISRAVWQPLGVACSLWAWFGWLVPWFAALVPQVSEAGTPSAAAFLFAAALLGYASAALVDRMNLPGLTAATVRLVILLALLGMAWLTYAGGSTIDGSAWRTVWVLIFGLGYTWWRAGRLSAGEALDPDVTLGRLFAGTLLAAAAFVLFPRAAMVGSAFLPLYLAIGLAGVALGQVGDASRRRGGRPLPFGLPWYAGLLLGVVLVVASGVAVGAVLTSKIAWGLAGELARLLAGVAQALGAILTPIVEAIFRIVGPVIEALILWLRSLLEGAEPVQLTLTGPIPAGAEEASEAEGTGQLLAQVSLVLRFLATVLGAAVLLWVAIRTTRRTRFVSDVRQMEQVEPIGEQAPGGGEGGLRAFLRAALRLPRRARGLYHALLVRRVYAQLLEWAAGEGRPRRLAETPLEFGVALASLRPHLRTDLDEITQAYLRVRYGETPEEVEMVRGVLAAWDRVRRSAAAFRPSNEGNSR